MPRSILNAVIGLAAAAVLMATAAGCERTSEGKPGHADRAAPPVAKVEVVRPERQTVRRSVGEPGQFQAFETTAIHAKIPGYVEEWTVNIGAAVKKGQVLAELAVPELDAELRQKQAAVEQAIAQRSRPRPRSRWPRPTSRAPRRSSRRPRPASSGSRPTSPAGKPSTTRVEELFQARAQTGSLLDETRNKLRSSEASREEVRAQVKTAEVALTQSRAALDQARSDVVAAAAAIEVAKEDARRVEAMLGYTKIEAPFDGIVTRAERRHRPVDQAGQRRRSAVRRGPVRYRDHRRRRPRDVRRCGRARRPRDHRSSRR